MRWTRSLAESSGVGVLVAEASGLDVAGCVLVRSLTNDVYRVDTADGGAYCCKIYAHGRWSAGQVAWEQDLATHLAAAGITGAAPVPLRDGSLVGTLDAPEGPRSFTVTVWAAGDKPRPPWTDELFRRFGAAVARFHRATEGFVSRYQMKTDDPLSTLDRALPPVVERLPDGRFVAKIAAAARSALGEAVDVGVRHGDASLDNVHVDGRGALLLHDFDLSAVGWRAADLTGASSTARWPAFLDGYRAERPIDTDRLVALRVVDLVGNLAWHLVDKVALRGTESAGEGWVERELASLRELADRL